MAVPPRREVVTAVRLPSDAVALALGASTTGSPGDVSLSVVLPEETKVRAADHSAADAPALTLRPASPPPSTAEPLTEALSRLHLTVSKDFLRKLEAAREALSHSQPGASADEILEAGLDLLLQQGNRRRGFVAKPRKTPPPSAPDSDQVPAHVRREVWQRDQGRCQWPMADGSVCASTHCLELDHVLPKARGGPPTVANLRVLCHRHNAEAARRAYGDAFMDGFTLVNRATGSSPPRYLPARRRST